MKTRMEEQYQEKKIHGSVLFPFNIYPCTIPKDFPSVSLHWHKSMEIIYIKKGLGRVQLGMQQFEAKIGDIFVIPPGILHAIRKNGKNVMEYENIIFEVDFLGGGAADVCAQEYLIPLSAGRLIAPCLFSAETEGYEPISLCLKEAEYLCKVKVKGYELGVKATVLKLLYWLMQYQQEAAFKEGSDMEKLKLVLQELENNYSEDLTVAWMAEKCGWSNSHFMRWFKKMTGSSFITYLNERRLAAAAEELRRTDDKILAIAEKAGFDNLSNFNRQFKKRYGKTPREYRTI